MDANSAWKSFSEKRVLDTDGRLWWSLLESAVDDASAADVVAFLEAARQECPGARLWEPMFDPLLAVPGLVARWTVTVEPLRSSLGYGLLRAGLARAEQLPSDVCERVAAEYLEVDEEAFLLQELEVDSAAWPDGRFVRALREAALATDESLAWSVVRFAAVGASERDAMLLALRAFTNASLELEPNASWGLLEAPSEAALHAIRSLAHEWLREPQPTATPIMRFRAFRVLLEHGRATERDDELLSAEMFDWLGDLPSNPPCGLCGGAHDESRLLHEPSPAVVHLLARLPLERALRVVARAEQDPPRREVAALTRRWLSEGSEARGSALGPRGASLTSLPEPVREAIAFAWSRLMIADDGHLPRPYQQEVLASFWPKEPPRPPPDLAVAVPNMRARVSRLLELGAPPQVLMRDASRLRALERLAWSGTVATSASASQETDRERDDEGFRRQVALSSLVLQDLAGADPRFAPLIAQLERLRRGEAAPGPNAGHAFEISWEASPEDPIAAIGHFGYCAIDAARGDDRRTDQDDLYDIAERAQRLRSDAAIPIEAHAELDAERRLRWWTRWLVELVPEALR